ncbi:BTB/POZ domain-containing protein 17 [Paramecium bursaria]
MVGISDNIFVEIQPLFDHSKKLEKILDCDTKKFICEIHHECELLFLYFGESPKLKSRLLCPRCIIGVVNTEEKQPALLYLKDFLSNPGNQLMKITRINGSINKGNESEQIDQIEHLLQIFEDIVKKQVEVIRQNLAQLKVELGTIATELNNNLKLNDVVQQFQLLAQMDCYQGTNELVQLEDQLNNISANLNKTYSGAKEKAKDNQTLIVNSFQNNFKTIQNEYDQFSKATLNILQNIVFFGIPEILNEDLGLFPQIHHQISQGKLIQYQLLYQGTRDGLHGSKYWAKCNGQSNLLTIMTSKNGNRFGSFSPCQINSGLNNYVQDPTLKSFLFQYNKKEIYKIKNQVNAIYCNAQYGPTYGGHDIYVGVDFNIGHSSGLGHSYDLSGYNIIDKTNHIFGATTPQLQECKVYKVIF